ncbi:MAG TPA: hypothetical protein VK890_10830 [Bacteroidia bacterium]|jgi:hypothetical protein|nr:hypothetical protein [Bacteroidia bacterium]
MIKGALISVLCALFWGCSNVEVKKEFYSNGEIKSRKHLTNSVVDTFEFYYPNDCTRKIIYGLNGKINQDLISLHRNNFIPFSDNIELAYITNDKDTVTIGGKFEAQIFLMVAHPDSLSNVRVEIGDTSSTESENSADKVKLIKDDFLIHAQYSTTAKNIGINRFYALIRCKLPQDSKLTAYPCTSKYFVKEK